MRRGGFTLIELLVSVAVLGLLAGLLFPAINGAREHSRANECRSNLHQFVIDMHDRMDRKEVIPDFLDAQLQLECPTSYDMLRAPGTYEQFCSQCKLVWLLEECQVPSERIVHVFDIVACHNRYQNASYLDGHVGTVQADDVKQTNF